VVGNKLKSLRIERNWGQEDVATRMNISRSTVGMHEQNRRMPDIPTLIDYAKLYDVSIDWLLDHKLTTKQIIGLEEFRQLLISKKIMSPHQDLTLEQFESLLNTYKALKDIK
jgi:transcriptional regulator with XRE-family HTH domain